MKIRPLYDRLILQVMEEDNTSKSLLIVIDESNKDKPVIGDVIGAGPGKYLEDGTLKPMEVVVGNKVLFTKSSAQLVRLENEDFYVVREEDVFGVL
jgi:chaperonin GroES